jgi:uncharacterized RDD family membrane protein YckC
MYTNNVAIDIAVLSPEKTVLTYRLAGLGSRIVAHFVDLFIVVAFLIFSSMLTGSIFSLMGEEGAKITGGIQVLMVSLFPFAYFICFEAFWNGQTPGKKLSGLRVRMADGTPVTLAGATSRNLLRIADMFPGTYFVGVIAMFVNPRFQRIGDLVANTIVVHEAKVIPNFSIAPHRVGVHPLEHLVGELRNMSDDQYYLLRRYCDRYPALEPSTQDRLTENVWQPIATRIGVNMVEGIHPLYLAEAVVMKYGRVRGLL